MVVDGTEEEPNVDEPSNVAAVEDMENQHELQEVENELEVTCKKFVAGEDSVDLGKLQRRVVKLKKKSKRQAGKARTCRKCNALLCMVRDGAFTPMNEEGYYHTGRYCPFEPTGTAPIRAWPGKDRRAHNSGKRAEQREAKKEKP